MMGGPHTKLNHHYLLVVNEEEPIKGRITIGLFGNTVCWDLC